MPETRIEPDVYLDPRVERSLQNRLSRLEGQVRGVKRMLDERESCDDILAQLAAVKSAVNGAARELLEGHMETCVLESVEAGRGREAFDSLKGAMARYLKHS